MQVNNSYDVEGVLPGFVPQPICESEEFQYIVTDNSWEEQAMATVRFNNAMYELNRVVTAGANNAMAFIGHDRDAAVQRALANAAGKAMEGVNVGGKGWSTFGNINNGMAFVSSSAFEYVHQTLDRSTKYIVDGVSTTKDVHFKVPDVKIKGWQMPHINVYIHNVGAVRTASNILKGASWITGGIGMYMTYREIQAGQKNWIGEGGLDMFMGVVGFIPGWGWAISAIYFTGGKYIWNKYGDDMINFFH